MLTQENNMNTKDIEENVWKILERIFPKGYDIDAKLVEDLRVILTQHHEAEVERRVEDICRNHLEELEDALNDPDLYGAINGMVHGLRTFLTLTKTDETLDPYNVRVEPVTTSDKQ